MHVLANPHRPSGLPDPGMDPLRLPSADAAAVARLLAQCPAARPTPLLARPDIAARTGVAEVLLKDERARMGLGSFKALGAAYAIARDAEATGRQPLAQALAGRTYVAASAGNHGLSVAAGARVFGAAAVIYLSETVSDAFAARLRAKGAHVVRAGATYEASMEAAQEAAAANGWVLLSDSSWPGYWDLPTRVMEGYLQLAAEVAEAVDRAPTHIFLQAGVGGLAAAVATYARRYWGDGPRIVVVEPEAAPALLESIRAGRPVETAGPVSIMGRLDCKVPSLIALAGLARDADVFATITEAEAEAAVAYLAEIGLDTTPSGAAGVAGLLSATAEVRQTLGLGPDSRVLAVLSEGTGAP